MSLSRCGLAFLLGVCLTGLTRYSTAADHKSEPPIITDVGGKDVTLKTWKIVGGIRKLAWLPDKTEAFEVREFGSTTYREGVLTLVPMTTIGSIVYDYEKETAYFHLAGMKTPLEGTTKYKDINMITIRAEVDQGKSGVADVRFQGGVIKTGFKQVKFPNPKDVGPEPKGELFSFLVVPEGKGKNATVMTATSVKALYRFADGSEKLLPWLMFKKTLKVDLAEMQKLHVGEYNVKEKTAECEVQKKDGTQLSVTLLSTITEDGKPATLVGLVGGVPAGWKLFPIHTFTEFQPGELKIEEKKETPLPPKKVETPKKTEPKEEAKKDEPKKVEPKKEESKK